MRHIYVDKKPWERQIILHSPCSNCPFEQAYQRLVKPVPSHLETQKNQGKKGDVALEHNRPTQLFSFYYVKQKAVLPQLLDLKSNVRTNLKITMPPEIYNLGIISLQFFSQPHLIVAFYQAFVNKTRKSVPSLPWATLRFNSIQFNSVYSHLFTQC